MNNGNHNGRSTMWDEVIPTAQLPVSPLSPMFDPTINPETVTRLLGAAGVRSVRLELADLHGIARSKNVPLSAFPKAIVAGIDFYGGTLHWDIFNNRLPAAAYPGPPPDLPEYLATPYLTTLAVLAHAPHAARVVCDLRRRDGRPAPLSPRNVVRRLVADYARLGYRPRLGFEHEFYLTAGEQPPATAERPPAFAG